MKKQKTNYAFIDGQNLNLSTRGMGWKLDFRKFRAYLREKYDIDKAYYFIGYVSGNNDLYTSLQSYGYVLIFKPTMKIKGGRVKGNCDAELVLQVMVDLNKYDKALIVTSDGDFVCLIKYLRQAGKLLRVLAPSLGGSSHLLRSAAQKQIAFMDDLRSKLEYI